eukprot:UC1_evm2s1226
MAPGAVSTDEILRFSTLFSDELTLDNLSREQLRACCRLLAITPIGTSQFLRFQLRTRIAQLKVDDLLIAQEGVESMDIKELQAAARERGMRAIGVSETALRDNVAQWVDLHLNHGVPSSLLLLSRVMFLAAPELDEPEKIKKVIESLSESAKDQAKIELLESEGADVDRQTRLKALKAEEKAVQEETEEETLRAETARQKEEADMVSEAARQAAEALEAQQQQAAPEKQQPASAAGGTSIDAQVQGAAAIKSGAAASFEAKNVKEHSAAAEAAAAAAAREKLVDSAPDLSSETMIVTPPPAENAAEALLTLEDCIDLAQAIVDMGGEPALAELQDLKEDVAEYELASTELYADTAGELGTRREARALANRVEKMILAIEQDSAATMCRFKVLDFDDDGVISTYELFSAMRRMKNPPSEGTMRRFATVIDADSDGRVDLDILRRVLEVVKEEGADLDPTGLKTIVRLAETEKAVGQKQNS